MRYCPQNKKGTALVIVITFALVLSTFSLVLLNSTIDNSSQVLRMEEELKMLSLSEGALELLISQLQEDPKNQSSVETLEYNGVKGRAEVETVEGNVYKLSAWAESQKMKHKTKYPVKVRVELLSSGVKLLEWDYQTQTIYREAFKEKRPAVREKTKDEIENEKNKSTETETDKPEKDETQEGEKEEK